MFDGVLPRGLKAIILDMDGVIVHSTPIHNEAWQKHLARHGIVVDRNAIETKMLGKHNDEIVRIFFGSELSAEQIVRHGAEKEQIYRELMAPRLAGQLVPGVEEFVEAYSAFPLGVATNAEPENVRFVLDRSSLRKHFRVVLDGGEVQRPKPDPEIYRRAAELLGAAPPECLIFEDSETGIRAARAAGARVIGLTTTSPQLDGCELTIESFADPRLGQWMRAAGR